MAMSLKMFGIKRKKETARTTQLRFYVVSNPIYNKFGFQFKTINLQLIDKNKLNLIIINIINLTIYLII